MASLEKAQSDLREASNADPDLRDTVSRILNHAACANSSEDRRRQIEPVAVLLSYGRIGKENLPEGWKSLVPELAASVLFHELSINLDPAENALDSLWDMHGGPQKRRAIQALLASLAPEDRRSAAEFIAWHQFAEATALIAPLQRAALKADLERTRPERLLEELEALNHLLDGAGKIATNIHALAGSICHVGMLDEIKMLAMLIAAGRIKADCTTPVGNTCVGEMLLERETLIRNRLAYLNRENAESDYTDSLIALCRAGVPLCPDAWSKDEMRQFMTAVAETPEGRGDLKRIYEVATTGKDLLQDNAAALYELCRKDPGFVHLLCNERINRLEFAVRVIGIHVTDDPATLGQNYEALRDILTFQGLRRRVLGPSTGELGLLKKCLVHPDAREILVGLALARQDRELAALLARVDMEPEPKKPADIIRACTRADQVRLWMRAGLVDGKNVWDMYAPIRDAMCEGDVEKAFVILSALKDLSGLQDLKLVDRWIEDAISTYIGDLPVFVLSREIADLHEPAKVVDALEQLRARGAEVDNDIVRMFLRWIKLLQTDGQMNEDEVLKYRSILEFLLKNNVHPQESSYPTGANIPRQMVELLEKYAP